MNNQNSRTQDNNNDEVNNQAMSGNNMKTNDNEMVFTIIKNNDNKIPENWYMADTGASSHMVKNMEGMKNINKCNIPIIVGNRNKVIAKKKGSKTITVNNK